MRSPAGEHDDYELPMVLKGPRDRSEGLPGLSTFAGEHACYRWRRSLYDGMACNFLARQFVYQGSARARWK